MDEHGNGALGLLRGRGGVDAVELELREQQRVGWAGRGAALIGRDRVRVDRLAPGVGAPRVREDLRDLPALLVRVRVRVKG